MISLKYTCLLILLAIVSSQCDQIGLDNFNLLSKFKDNKNFQFSFKNCGTPSDPCKIY